MRSAKPVDDDRGRLGRQLPSRAGPGGVTGTNGPWPAAHIMSLQPRLPQFLRIALTSMLLVAVAAAGALLHAGLRGAGAPDDGAQLGTATLVFAEFGPNADSVYATSIQDPAERTLIRTVQHAPGWGLNPSVGVVAGKTAYTVLPPEAAPYRDSPAELWLLNVITAEATRLARDADLLAAPVLSEDGRMLAYRRTDDSGTQAIVQVDLETRARRVLHSEASAFGMFPIGFDRSGAVLVARLAPSGTDLLRVVDGAPATLLLHASDEIARDWRVAPGGDSVAFLAPELSRERMVHRVHVVSLDGSPSAAGAPPADDGEQYAPAWRWDGALAIGAAAAPLVVGTSETVALPASSGFDVPLGWSVAGDYLAVRHFDGISSQAPGAETLVVIGNGTRTTVESTRELIFLGWTGA